MAEKVLVRIDERNLRSNKRRHQVYLFKVNVYHRLKPGYVLMAGQLLMSDANTKVFNICKAMKFHTFFNAAGKIFEFKNF